jgi:hypothetical protein
LRSYVLRLASTEKPLREVRQLSEPGVLVLFSNDDRIPGAKRKSRPRKGRTMFSKKCLCVPLAVILISCFGACAANAQSPASVWDPPCPYTLASLQGSYSVVVNYGGNVALGLQAQTLDGNGNLTRTGVLNEPTPGSATGQRTVGIVSNAGTYTVNCNGTGTITRVVTRPDGSTAPSTDDFIITQAIKFPGRPAIATTIVDATRNPSVILPGGVFVTHVHTRLPD